MFLQLFGIPIGWLARSCRRRGRHRVAPGKDGKRRAAHLAEGRAEEEGVAVIGADPLHLDERLLIDGLHRERRRLEEHVELVTADVLVRRRDRRIPARERRVRLRNPG